MKKWIFAALAVFGLLFSLPSIAGLNWQKLSPGLYYTVLTPHPLKQSAHVIAFRIDPSKYSFNSVLASNTINSPTAYVTQIAKEVDGLIAINGGYFSQAQNPLGLRVNNYKTLSKLKNISWWGVFYLKNNRPYLSSSKGFNKSSHISFAIQAGPRLLVDGNILKLKPGIADRSALGITRSKKIIIAITQNLGLSLSKWAALLKQVGCRDALNLDGGSSSQLYVNLKSLHFVIPNFKPVTDAVVVK